MPHRKALQLGRQVWANLAVVALLFSVVPGTWLYLQNRHRIDDIQQSRIISCKHTYEAFNEVFRPFFPPANKQTEVQKHSLHTLQKTVRDLKSRCAVQTSTKETP